MHSFLSSGVIEPTVRRIGLAAAVLVLAAALAGCGEQPATEAGPTPSKPPTALRLAYGKKIHYAPQILAIKQGLFAREGLALDAKAVQAGIQAADLLHSQGKIPALPDWDTVIDRSFVQRMSEAG